MRKIITVPKDELALKALEYDNANSDQLYEMSLSEVQFRSLWEIGIFDSINKIANANIDNFEDEQITDIVKLNKVILSGIFDANFSDTEVDQAIKKIKELFLKSIQCNTGVFFYF